jgi:putative endonuclease
MPVTPRPNRKQVGKSGEADAARFLAARGYTVAAMNVRPMPGLARGEIDIVAWDGPVLCFVEVKTRRSSRLPPDLGITSAKRKQIVMLAGAYLSVNQIDPECCRFDVVSVWNDPALPCPMVMLHKDAFGVE